MKNKKYTTSSTAAQEEALRIAKATQKPQQTKEQTKLIAQGIQKGIEQYKKQQKAKAREQDKLKKKIARAKASNDADNITAIPTESITLYKHNRLAWGLLAVSWLGFITYVFLH